MPIFECSRCNDMTYSSSRENVAPCPACGCARKRLVHDSASFAEAKAVPRATSYGDHSIAIFDEFEQIAPIAAQFVDQGVVAGGLVMAMVPQALEELIRRRLHPDDAAGVTWEPPGDTYGPAFDPSEVVDRFREIAESEARPVFVIGCPDAPVQTITSRDGWVEYERMAHELAVQYGMTVLCLYDARLHDEGMLRTGLQTHALTVHDGELRRNEAFDYERPPGESSSTSRA